MPIYSGRRPGTFRITVWCKGKPHERVVSGTRNDAEHAELQFREMLGAKRQGASGSSLPEIDATSVFWIGTAFKSVLYFVQIGEEGPIKIGYTTRPAIRLSSLRTGSPLPLRLVCAIPGGRELEAALHAAFASSRLDGEWFSPTKKLVALMAELSSATQDAEPDEIRRLREPGRKKRRYVRNSEPVQPPKLGYHIRTEAQRRVT